MNKTINIILVSIIVVAWLTQSVEGDICRCSCCLGNGCTATNQGSFQLDSCTSMSCIDQCRVKYASCPQNMLQSGSVQGFCTSTSALAPSKGYQQQANSIWVIMFFSLFIIVKKYM
ncbi:unnamed protein product [Adineta steineri]|uniref:Uncharacterized protein n=1 Tax=Adineta steineri TaxID=433720 RepID=A0A814ADY9_9BILA|nr:unnamed protein product [Adineta steineri]